jgi:hypothetical protein
VRASLAGRRRPRHGPYPCQGGDRGLRTCLALFPLPLRERVAEGRVRGPAARGPLTPTPSPTAGRGVNSSRAKHTSAYKAEARPCRHHFCIDAIDRAA